MTDQELIRALRCTSTPGGPLMDCEKCPYRVVEAVPEHLREQVGSDEWESCDVDKIGVDAADRLTSLMEDLERVTRERDAAVAQLASLDVCIYCKNGHCAARNGTKECEFEWIGKDEALGGGGDG